jgi:RNA polymerase sigma factor (sigma-70 family)
MNKQFFININGSRAEVTEEVYLTYYRSKRRDRYYEQDIKIATAIRDKNGVITGYAPSKEDSIDRLIDTGADFADGSETVEDIVLRGFMLDKLHVALGSLPETERALIDALFFQGMTEREAAIIFGISQKGINKRKTVILGKLKKLLEN